VANYKILIKPSAVKELKKISNPDFDRIKEKIRTLSFDPPQRVAKNYPPKKSIVFAKVITESFI